MKSKIQTNRYTICYANTNGGMRRVSNIHAVDKEHACEKVRLFYGSGISILSVKKTSGEV